MPEASSSFLPALASVSAARHFLTATLAAWPADHCVGCDMAAQLVVTELAANAVLHARSGFTVRLRLEPGCLVVEVHDDSPKLPRARSFSAEAATGRGLRLVDALARGWGAAPDGTGKVVWATLEPDGIAAAFRSDAADPRGHQSPDSGG